MNKQLFTDVYNTLSNANDANFAVYVDGQKIDMYEGKTAKRYCEFYPVDELKETPFGYIVKLSQPDIAWKTQGDMECGDFTNMKDNLFAGNVVGFITVDIGLSAETGNVHAEVGIVKQDDEYIVDFMSQGIENDNFVGVSTRFRTFPVNVPEDVRQRALNKVYDYVMENKDKFFFEEELDDHDIER